MEATSIDLVRIVMEAQARGQRIRNVQSQLKSMVLGDVDRDMTALPTVKAKDFDSTISAAGVITKKAYIKWLRHNAYKANLTRVLTGHLHWWPEQQQDCYSMERYRLRYPNSTVPDLRPRHLRCQRVRRSGPTLRHSAFRERERILRRY